VDWLHGAVTRLKKAEFISRCSWVNVLRINVVGVNRLINWFWVRTRTVPMRLGLIDLPFVPHNLISDEESPVPLPKFQIAPRAKF
jgi:hypothetical protein